ncbi:uncharacterized protein LOC135471555 [Liolophura sinensis]|uniref:uncharacterized protein LOC135471555 n=1 Tax=Liolophura sinensis TaxID=3198878 RepID=UPI003158FC89
MSVGVTADPYCTPYPTGSTDPNSKAPPLPQFPQDYHVHVEANMIEQGYTLDSSEYYDSYLNKAAITLNYADQTVTLVYSYGTNELFTITDLKDCVVTQLSTDDNRFLFGDTVSNGRVHVYNSAGAFRFGKTFGEKYLGSTYVRGVPVDHWQACLNWPEKKSTFTVDYFFTAMNWSTASNEDQIPVRADVQGVSVGDDGSSKNFHHVYDFYHYRPDHGSTHDDTDKYETPPGVICPGRNKTRPLPTLKGQFFYRQQIVVPDGNLVMGADVWYDSEYKLVRWDYRNSQPKAPFWTTNPLSEIHDFNTGVAYVTDQLLGNCSIVPIEATAFDVTEKKTGKSPSAASDPRYAVRIKNPQEMFFLDDSYDYVGQRTIEDKLCDLYVSNRTDFVVPGTTGPYRTIFEFYFLSTDWTEETNDGISAASAYPVRLILSAEDIGFQSIYNFYDFNEEHPDLTNFDITQCFSEDEMTDFQVHFSGRFIPLVDQNRKYFELEARLGLAKYAGISPIRLQRSSFHYNTWSFYLEMTLLDRPPMTAQFHKYNGKVLANNNDKSVPDEGDPNMCANLCITETSFVCNSFDICPRKNMCFLSKSTVDDGVLLDNSQCSHYSRNIVNQTIIGAQASTAYSILKTLIYKNMVTVQIPLPAGKMKNYRAISIRNNIVRDITEAPTLSSGAKLSQFTSVRNKALRGNNEDLLPGVTVDDCAAACVDEDVFFCQSFEYCFNTGDCHLSKRHPGEVPSMIIDSNNCDLYSRNYSSKYTKTPGTVILERGQVIYQKIVGAEMCAKLCSDLHKFTCKSFQYCDDISTCALSPTHFMDIPRSDIKAEPLCDHYTRNYIDDFKFIKGRQLALTNNQIIEGVTVGECAKICAEQGTGCLGFDYCGNDTYCRLTSDSVKNVGQVTLESNAFCNHYSRQYYSDGSSVTSFSVKNQKDSSLIYGNGSAAALGVIMFLMGILLTVAGYIGFMKFYRGQSLDLMKQNFVTMDTLEQS